MLETKSKHINIMYDYYSDIYIFEVLKVFIYHMEITGGFKKLERLYSNIQKMNI